MPWTEERCRFRPEAASGLLTDPVLAVGSPWNYTQVEGQVDLKREAMAGLVRSTEVNWRSPSGPKWWELGLGDLAQC